ncbi:hypothetical protein OXX80_011923, partial [Metschnikowia pulcherrima]
MSAVTSNDKGSSLDSQYASFTDTAESTRWAFFKNSFKPASRRHLANDDLTSLERAVQNTAQTDLQSTISPLSQAFIALGGCVGSGLLIVSGQSLSVGGPAGILIGWAVVSTFLYCVMQALS